MTYVKEDFVPWSLQQHSGIKYVESQLETGTICDVFMHTAQSSFIPQGYHLPFFICLVFPSISSFIKMCVFGKGAPVSLSPYISVVPLFQKVKSTEIFLYFDYKVPARRY